MISLILIPTFFAASSNFLSLIESLKNLSFSNNLASLLFRTPPWSLRLNTDALDNLLKYFLSLARYLLAET